MQCYGKNFWPSRATSFHDQLDRCRHCQCVGRHEAHYSRYARSRENDLKENKFIKSISESTQILDGRVQVRMPRKTMDPQPRATTILHTNEWSPVKMFKSLNDHLWKGPNFINSLPNVLMAWPFKVVLWRKSLVFFSTFSKRNLVTMSRGTQCTRI